MREDNTMWEQLVKAIEAGRIAEALELIGQLSQAELSQVNKNGETALHLAVWSINRNVCEYTKICELLIEKMTPEAVNAVTTGFANGGRTALIMAACKESTKICKLLIPKMSNKAINAVDNNGHTALYAAASEGMEEVCGLLISIMDPVAINAIDKDRQTALHMATFRGLEGVCASLIPKMSKDAISTISKYGNTALTRAASKEMSGICKLLIPKMNLKSINAKDHSEMSALHYVAQNGDTEIAWLLLDAGADNKVCDLIKRTPAKVAANKGHYLTEKVIKVGLLAFPKYINIKYLIAEKGLDLLIPKDCINHILMNLVDLEDEFSTLMYDDDEILAMCGRFESNEDCFIQ